MSSVVISGDTSGAITLSAPAVSGTNTATLPAATGTVMVSGNMPAFNAYPTGSSYTTFTSGTTTKVALGSEVFDTNSCFDSTTNYRFTPTVAGYYQINASVSTNYTGTQYTNYQVLIYKNGTGGGSSNIVAANVLIEPATAGVYGSMPISTVVYFNGSTDYIELYVYATVASGSPAYNQGTYQTFLSGSMVRSA